MTKEIRLKADFHSAENIARSTFSAHFLLNCSNQIQISEHISKESERERSIARHFPLNGNPPLGPVYMRPGRCQTGMKIEIVSMFT